ncbi:MAG: amidohydrolase family protein [Desulfobacteraceae bacterium]
MQQHEAYIGFPPLPGKEAMVEALLHDPPHARWHIVRQLFQIKEISDREDLIQALQPHLKQADDWRLFSRLHLALQALHRPLKVSGYHLVKGKGAVKVSEDGQLEEAGSSPFKVPLFPVVDFHIQPKTPDLKFFGHIKKSLYTPTQVTNHDVAEWVRDYPDILIGVGSVNLGKDQAYVRRGLNEIERLKLKGLKYQPHAQFFNPSKNEHMPMVFEFCKQGGHIILSHTGCGQGPFEMIELSQNSHPSLWEPWLKKYPEVPMVFCHAGAYSTEIPGIWLFDALQLAKSHPNVYIDLAGVDWLLDRENVIQEIRKTIGFDRVLFATDYPAPLSTGASWAYVAKRVQTNSNLTPKEKHKILGKNAARLLGLS